MMAEVINIKYENESKKSTLDYKVHFHHVFWSTKNQLNSINRKIKPILINQIKKYSSQNNIEILAVNGTADHIHILFCLKPLQNVKDIIELIKIDSATFLNNLFEFEEKFAWEKGYYSEQITEGGLALKQAYIHLQEEIHSKKNFLEEYNNFKNKYGFD